MRYPECKTQGLWKALENVSVLMESYPTLCRGLPLSLAEHGSSQTVQPPQLSRPQKCTRACHMCFAAFLEEVRRMIANQDFIDPPTVKVTHLMSKQKAPKAASMESFCWIGTLGCCAKWFATCLLPLIAIPKILFGRRFRTGYRCEHIRTIIQETMLTTYRWGRPLVALGVVGLLTSF